MQLAMVVGPRMRVRGRCGTSKLWLVTVIIVLALLQLHVMVGVAATRVPSALLHENSFKDQNADDISGCGFFMSTMPVARHLLERGPPGPGVYSPPTPKGSNIGH
ncbi:unnamed protein product [Sphagnum jensenii]|uniref:Uncharacterized protein n=1 Tax=Sphagnum jensenii TaxID=128206 RepID=A0ABP1B036_9BRYO